MEWCCFHFDGWPISLQSTSRRFNWWYGNFGCWPWSCFWKGRAYDLDFMEDMEVETKSYQQQWCRSPKHLGSWGPKLQSENALERTSWSWFSTPWPATWLGWDGRESSCAGHWNFMHRFQRRLWCSGGERITVVGALQHEGRSSSLPTEGQPEESWMRASMASIRLWPCWCLHQEAWWEPFVLAEVYEKSLLEHRLRPKLCCCEAKQKDWKDSDSEDWWCLRWRFSTAGSSWSIRRFLRTCTCNHCSWISSSRSSAWARNQWWLTCSSCNPCWLTRSTDWNVCRFSCCPHWAVQWCNMTWVFFLPGAAGKQHMPPACQVMTSTGVSVAPLAQWKGPFAWRKPWRLLIDRCGHKTPVRCAPHLHLGDRTTSYHFPLAT